MSLSSKCSFQANDELKLTQEKLDAVVGKSDDANMKANQERDCIKADLDAVSQDLERIK
jgi:hypothetical protein